ncbi:acyl-CoA thioesterase [Myxococcota bacterium]|nr:acyl-CoA thioesterase [Myxococcota bacterium]
MFETEIGIPRHAAGPRQVARAGEIWRLFQELAIQASTAVGWSPARYLEQGTAFVVYGMTAVHHREVAYGERLRARTWVHDFKRDTLTRRQIRLSDARGPVAACTQQWAHVDARLRPSRAPAALLAALPVERPDEPSVELPAVVVPLAGGEHRFTFQPWHTWMDPLAHVNHPAYVDFCDEGTSRALAAAGVDPQGLVPVAEHVAFKVGALAGQQVEVLTRVVGRTAAGDVVLSHEVGGEAPFARATTVRRLVDGGDLARALGA